MSVPVPAVSSHYWAFLSYCSQDRAAARWLQRALETYVVPRRLVGRLTPAGLAPTRFRPIFRDRTELAADADLGARIESALAQSAYLIVLCSPQAAKSRWVDREIVAFRAHHGTARIFSVIVGGSTTGEHLDCFPQALRYQGDSGGAGPEPIAVDLRPGGDGRRMGRLKLLAGMLGVGLDELVRRDTQRRHRFLIVIAGAALAGMAVMCALAMSAYLARNEARRQQAHAESLIEFMLTDLRKKLEPRGNLEFMDGVGKESLKYYSAQTPSDLDAESLARRARALRLMGEISVQRGDLDEALSSFEQASATTGELLARAPLDGQRVFNHAQNVFWVGEIARQRGDMVKAEASFQRYRGLAEQLTAIDPAKNDWRDEIAYADTALGTLYMQNGRPGDAAVAFERSLAVMDDLAHRLPGELNHQYEVGQGHAWLANALEKQARILPARVHREAELAIYREILAKDPTFRQAKFSTIVALDKLGRIKTIGGDVKGALDDFSNSAGRAEALLINERENMDLAAVVGVTQIEFGEALLAGGQVNAARGAQQRGALLLDEVLAHDSSVALWRSYRSRAVLLEASIAGQMGEHTKALGLDQDVLRRMAEAKTAPNTDEFWLLERCRLQTGDDLSSLGRTEDARQDWEAIAQSLAGPIETYEARLLVILEATQMRLGRSTAAQAIAKRLRELSAGAGGSGI
jgi:eukaryotic-like serine/threonine-protein kinase